MTIRRERETGSTRCYLKNETGSWMLSPDDHDSVLGDWKNGKAFWDGLDYYGARITIKLGDVAGITRSTQQSIAMRRADLIRNRDEDRLDGFDDL